MATTVPLIFVGGTIGPTKIGGASNNTQFEADGTMVYNGDATVWRDINLTGASLQPLGAAAPDMVNFVDANLQVYAFDGNTTVERLYGSCEMQHDYKEGTDILVHVHWAPTTAGAGAVVWQIYYSWQNTNSVYSAGTLLAFDPSITTSNAWNNRVVSATIPGAGKTINSQLVFQIFRDPGLPGDTYTADAALVQLGFHYECDTTGSRQPTVK